MPELNLYQGAYTGREVDQLLTRVKNTRGPLAAGMPVEWFVALSFSGTAGATSADNISFPSSSGFPNIANCEVAGFNVHNADGEVEGGTIVDWVRVTLVDFTNTVNIDAHFIESGTVKIRVSLIDGGLE